MCRPKLDVKKTALMLALTEESSVTSVALVESSQLSCASLSSGGTGSTEQLSDLFNIART